MKTSSVLAIFRALRQADVRFLVVGGLAVNSHGYVRATQDVDLVLHLHPDNIARAFEALAGTGYYPAVPITAADFSNPEQRRQWRLEKGMFVLKMWSDRHRETPVDIFIEEPFDFAQEYSRAKLEKADDDLWVPVVSLGALLQLKQAAGRPQDLADIAALRQLHGLS